MEDPVTKDIKLIYIFVLTYLLIWTKNNVKLEIARSCIYGCIRVIYYEKQKIKEAYYHTHLLC